MPHAVVDGGRGEVDDADVVAGAAMEAAWRATKTPRPGERFVGNQVVTMVTRMMLPRVLVRPISRAGAR